jgi:uncharacterized protein (DUF362 family)
MELVYEKVDSNNNTDILKKSVSSMWDKLNIQQEKPKKIIIKPNLCYYWDHTTGQTTSPILVSALVDVLRERFGQNIEITIAEADASAMKTRHVFTMLGYEKIAEEKSVNLLNLSENPKTVSTTIMGEQVELSFSEELLETDMMINIPKLKYHRLPKATGAMKNIFGAIAKYNKHTYHKQLSRIIVAANKIVHSDLVLVDGLIALGKTPTALNTLIMGTNVFTTDCITSKMLGFNPSSIEHLKLAQTEGFGKIKDSEKFWDKGLSDTSKALPRPNYLTQKLLWDSEIFGVKLYSRITGDVVPPILLQD